MTEAFQAAVHLARNLAVAVVEPVQDVGHGTALFRQEQIFHRHEFGDREAVVNLDEAELRCGSVIPASW